MFITKFEIALTALLLGPNIGLELVQHQKIFNNKKSFKISMIFSYDLLKRTLKSK